MTAGQPLVQFRNIAKTYDGEINVLEGLNLEIRQGEFLTLLGPSGSGKTTVLMMLAGFELPTDGDILLNGARLNDVPAHRRNMGVVFQSYALFPHMTVEQNVGYPLKHRNVPKKDRAKRVAKALKMVDLSAFGTRLPSQLSGGQQQRVALARALVFEPEIILMDEPLGALDKNLREHMQLELKRLHDRLGMTVVYVTHDQSEALTMSDRVAIFNSGDILQIGAPNDIYQKPVSSFVANFIGENNNLSGVLTDIRDGGATIRLATGTTIEAANPLAFRKDAAVNVVVRPEHLSVGQSRGTGHNALPARVRDVIYYGDHHRIEAEVDGIGVLTVKTGLGGQSAEAAIGSSIDVWWDPGQSLALNPLNAAPESP